MFAPPQGKGRKPSLSAVAKHLNLACVNGALLSGLNVYLLESGWGGDVASSSVQARMCEWREGAAVSFGTACRSGARFRLDRCTVNSAGAAGGATGEPFSHPAAAHLTRNSAAAAPQNTTGSAAARAPPAAALAAAPGARNVAAQPSAADLRMSRELAVRMRTAEYYMGKFESGSPEWRRHLRAVQDVMAAGGSARGRLTPSGLCGIEGCNGVGALGDHVCKYCSVPVHNLCCQALGLKDMQFVCDVCLDLRKAEEGLSPHEMEWL